MNRAFRLLFSSTIACALVSGCIFDTEKSDPPSVPATAPGPVVKSFGLAHDSLLHQDSLALTGTLLPKGTEVIGTFSVKAPTGHSAADLIVPARFSTKDSAFDLSKLKIKASDTAQGTYEVTLRVVFNQADSLPTTYTTSVAVTGLINSQGYLNLGAQNSSFASFLDFRNAIAYTTGTKPVADVDIIFFADANGTPTFLSPAAAAEASLGNLKNWAVLNQTIIVDVGTQTFNSAGEVKAALASRNSQSSPAVAGHNYAIRTTNGIYGVLTAVSLTGSGLAAEVEVKILE